MPRNVFLFSGHMIDAPGRKQPRFPTDKEGEARAAIVKTLREESAGEGDVAICSGACGGDLIFAEACLARGASLELYLPFDEATFLEGSVDFAGASWRQRFQAAKARATVHVMPVELGPLPDGANAYERVNMWMLSQASRFGGEKLSFICLWNGEGGDGPGGTGHLMKEARAVTGRVHWLNTKELWG